MIKPLTSLRMIFALMVFASHLDFLIEKEPTNLRWVYDNVFYEGYIGVSFFFILSGFILAFNYQSEILKGTNVKLTFYVARIARIYPLHVLTFILSIPLSLDVFLGSNLLFIKQVITNLTLTQSYFPIRDIYFSFNIPAWSISNEMFFYLLFPFLIQIFFKFNRFKKTWFIMIFALIPLLTLFISSKLFHQFFYISPFFRIIDFIIGIFIYNLYIILKLKNREINFNLLEISSIVLLVVFFIFHERIPQVARFSFYYWIPMCYLIIAFSFQKGFISKFLSKKHFVYLGEISFGLYMFHHLILRYISAINIKFFHLENEYAIISLCFILSIIVSHFSFKHYETPMNKYVKAIAYKNLNSRLNR